ncbi:MAG: sensor histidine kinase [Massilia sp.]|nr:sensor histidine kinase [Massilia sp.]
MLERLRFSARTVALCYVAASFAVLALFASPLWFTWRSTIDQGRDEQLHNDAQRMKQMFATLGPQALAAAIDTHVGDLLEPSEHAIFLLVDPATRKLAGNLPAWPSEALAVDGIQVATMSFHGRVVSVALLQQTLPGGYRLLVGRDIDRFEQLEKLFIYGLAGAGAIVLVIGALGALLVRRRLLAKVHDINRAASAIMQGNLSHRLPRHGGETELNKLIETENRMLDQIEHLVDGIRNVSNAIAHDLRTPLAELRARLEEVALTRPGAEHTFGEIEAAIADVDRVIAIFNALLRLAEIDAGTRRAGFVEVDAGKIAGEAAEFYQPVAEVRGGALSFASSGPLPMAGDPLLLAQAIGNLIDNALKYAPEHGTIRVKASLRADGVVEVTVADEGPGIPDELKEKVLERFYRGDASRGTAGAGLGLSLVAAVARLHGGVLELADNHPGLRASLVLPADQTPPSSRSLENSRSAPVSGSGNAIERASSCSGRVKSPPLHGSATG